MEKYYTMCGAQVQYLELRKVGEPAHYTSVVAVVWEDEQTWRVSTPFGIQDLRKSEWCVSQEPVQEG